MAAIQAATSSAARLLGVDGEVGIDRGRAIAADLLLVEGDPLADLGRRLPEPVVGRPGR